MKYRTRPVPPTEPKYISSGRREKDTYTLDIAPNGDKKLVKTGTTDIQKEIDSHRDLCDVKSIIERLTMSGEMDKLQARGAYVDLSVLPKNLAEMHDLIHKTEAAYANLPDNVKKDFPTYEAFMQNFANVTTIQQFMTAYQSTTKKEEVKPDASDQE